MERQMQAVFGDRGESEMSGHWGRLDESDVSHYWMPAGSEFVRSVCGREAAPENIGRPIFGGLRCAVCAKGEGK